MLRSLSTSSMRSNACPTNRARRSGDLYNALKIGSVKRSQRRGKHITIGVHRKDWSHEDYYPAYVEYGHGGPAPAPAHPYHPSRLLIPARIESIRDHP